MDSSKVNYDSLLQQLYLNYIFYRVLLNMLLFPIHISTEHEKGIGHKDLYLKNFRDES